MSDLLVVIALPEETAGLLEAAGAEVLYTGVGKVNASYRLTRELLRRRVAGAAIGRVLNLGTAGSTGWPRGAVVACDRFIQRDMDVSALGFAPGVTPFDATPAELRWAAELPFLPSARCATGDTFVTQAGADPADILDMEAFALARVCHAEGLRFACAKYLTDGADAAAAADWSGGVAAGAAALLEVYRRYAAA
jgi:adenosylhomocysteine nucleosidase